MNLERSLPADGRNSGHYVQGHVDATGEIVEKAQDGDSLRVTIRAPADVMRYVVPKGYVAVDGTSLTVCEVDAAKSTFTLMLVAYTQQHIIMPGKVRARERARARARARDRAPAAALSRFRVERQQSRPLRGKQRRSSPPASRSARA